MNARAAKLRREAEEHEFRVRIVALVEAQKSVIGALARAMTTAQKDIEDLKQQLSDVETIAVGAESIQ